MAMGMQGFFIIHPKSRPEKSIAISASFFRSGSSIRDVHAESDGDDGFQSVHLQQQVYPGTAPLIIRRGDRVRIRLANLSMDNHPIHFHGHRAMIVATDAGPIAPSAQWPAVTIDVPPGSTRDFEFVADNPGDWPLHCHKNHHAMNAMSHNIAEHDRRGSGQECRADRENAPWLHAHGNRRHARHVQHANGAAEKHAADDVWAGPFGAIMMGGMFTILKIRDELKDYQTDPGWYQQPAGTAARRVDGPG